jgi:hypothetical protein
MIGGPNFLMFPIRLSDWQERHFRRSLSAAVRSEIPGLREISGQGESVLRDARNSAAIRCLAFGVRSDVRKGLQFDMFVV